MNEKQKNTSEYNKRHGLAKRAVTKIGQIVTDGVEVVLSGKPATPSQHLATRVNEILDTPRAKAEPHMPLKQPNIARRTYDDVRAEHFAETHASNSLLPNESTRELEPLVSEADRLKGIEQAGFEGGSVLEGVHADAIAEGKANMVPPESWKKFANGEDWDVREITQGPNPPKAQP